MIRRNLLSFVVPLVCIASASDSPVQGQWNRVDEEDAVIKAALDYLTKGESGYVLIDSVPSWYDPEPIRGDLGRPVPPPDSVMADIVADYRKVNQTKRHVGVLLTEMNGVVVSDSVGRALQKEGRRLVFRVSRPGFSADRHTAIVDVVGDCGIRCGSRAVMVLHKDGEAWKFDRFLLYLVE